MLATRAFAALALILSAPAHAYDPDRAFANLTSDLTTCASYLMILSKSVEHNSTEMSQNYMDLALNFRGLAVQATSEKLTEARVNVTVESMLEEIDSDLGNVMILVDQYQTLCADIWNDIPARLDYWLAVED